MTTLKVNGDQIDPGFLSDVVGLLDAYTAATNVRAFITEGWRDRARQQALRDAFLADPDHAPRAADPSESAHVGANFPDDRARAVDVTLVVDGKDDWGYDHPAWQGLFAAIYAHPRLHSLHAIGDGDHIEKLHWQLDKTFA